MKKNARGDKLIQGMQEAIAYIQGKPTTAKVHQVQIPDEIDVRAIRERLHLSRSAFSREFGVSPRTLQHWEQGDRQPHGPARVLLLLLQKAPDIISGILRN